MSKPLRLGVKFVASLLFVLLFTRLWLTKPYLFPQIPESIAKQLVELYGAQNAEQVADLEIIIGLIGSFIVLLALLILAKVARNLLKI
jgi:hypothetical protein